MNLIRVNVFLGCQCWHDFLRKYLFTYSNTQTSGRASPNFYSVVKGPESSIAIPKGSSKYCVHIYLSFMDKLNVKEK